MTLPHTPGSLSINRLSPLPNNDTEDSFNSQIVGQDNRTGNPIIAEPGSSVTQSARYDSSQPVVNGASVTANRDRSTSRQGSRSVSITIPNQLLGETPFAPSQTQPFPDTEDADGCPPQSISIIINSNSNANTDQPPEPEPPPEQPPSDPQNPEEGETDEETPSDPSAPNGCDPESPSQWYQSSSCPSGTIQRGSYTDSGGQDWVLCEGASRPQGDGCPYSYPDLRLGYTCFNGSCILDPNGQFSTFAECQASGCVPEEPPQETRYSCVGGLCVVDPEGQFTSLSECNSSGCGGEEPPPENTSYLISGTACAGGPRVQGSVRSWITETASPGCTRYTMTLCNGAVAAISILTSSASIVVEGTCP